MSYASFLMLLTLEHFRIELDYIDGQLVRSAFVCRHYQRWPQLSVLPWLLDGHSPHSFHDLDLPNDSTGSDIEEVKAEAMASGSVAADITVLKGSRQSSPWSLPAVHSRTRGPRLSWLLDGNKRHLQMQRRWTRYWMSAC